MIIMPNNRIKEITPKMSTNIIASFSQCEECQGWGLGAVGGGDEEVGRGMGCGWAGGDVAGC